MFRFDIINTLIQKNGYKSFLEIGVCNGATACQIEVEDYTGVDPAPIYQGEVYTTHVTTSDEFFKTNKKTYDIAFIDGLHEAEQVYKDIVNTLEVLNEGGTIVCHDMMPNSFGCQQVPRIQQVWTGDCWKAWIKLRQERPDLRMKVVDTDWGCGVIQVGTQKVLDTDLEINYANFDKNRKEWLNLISIDEFNSIFA